MEIWYSQRHGKIKEHTIRSKVSFTLFNWGCHYTNYANCQRFCSSVWKICSTGVQKADVSFYHCMKPNSARMMKKSQLQIFYEVSLIHNIRSDIVPDTTQKHGLLNKLWGAYSMLSHCYFLAMICKIQGLDWVPTSKFDNKNLNAPFYDLKLATELWFHYFIPTALKYGLVWI